MIRKIEHIALMASNMEQSIQFYMHMFGFQLRQRGTNARREMAFLSHNEIPGIEIELMYDISPGDYYSEQGIVNHLAFTVDDIDAAIVHYRKKGIEFHSTEPATAIDGAKTIFFHGPNRELLQLVEPAPHRKPIV